MIVFYNTSTGYCIRSSNGVASDVEIINNQAFINGELHVKDMTDIAYEDKIDQDIYIYDVDGLPSPKLFSDLKAGVPIEARTKAIEDAIMMIIGV